MRLNRMFGGLKEPGEFLSLAIMLLLVVMVAFAALAVPMDEDSSEDDSLQVLTAWQGLTIALPLLLISLYLALTRGFTGKIHAAEYLDSHIGEKRFADDMGRLSVRVRVESLVTVLFGAPSLFYSCRRSWDCLRWLPFIEEQLPRSKS